MIIEKYPYQEIPRTTVNGRRLYSTESGPLPSVTTILEQTKPQDAIDGLNRWRHRVGHTKATQITNEAANVGSKMHAYLEDWAKSGEFVTGGGLPSIVAARMANTVIENIQDRIDEIWGTEVNLYFSGLYAGTTDLTGSFDGKPAIMDFKQSNKPKKSEWVDDYRLQIVAYALCHNELFGSEIQTGHIFMCTRDLEFQHFEILEDEFEEYSKKWAQRVEQFYDLDK